MILNRVNILAEDIKERLTFFGGNGYVIQTDEQRCQIIITDTADCWFYIDFEDGDGAITFEQSVAGKQQLDTSINYKLVARVEGLERIPVLEALIALMLDNHVQPFESKVSSQSIFDEEMGESEDSELKCEMQLIKINFTVLLKGKKYDNKCITQICKGC